MAWGYWSATTVPDRGRSPRRNQNGTNAASSSGSSGGSSRLDSSSHHSHTTVPQAAAAPKTYIDNPHPSASHHHHAAPAPVNSINNAQDFEDLPPAVFSRRPSLDLSTSSQMVTHVQNTAHVCAAHGSRHVTCLGAPGGGTLSAGNTLTRLGSRHTAVEYAVPHHFHIHHGTAYVEYHQPQLSFSDDDSSSEPGYATGNDLIILYF
ncbi:hypothetical protein HHI36_015031 [Cryptolaemus montrouzieri]|uniref:Uncharacterized protein n=1 Tax=Cryptolaemus montrouzieri TaxID=559131 RepID=A0ABD2N4W0_9CUCU